MICWSPKTKADPNRSTRSKKLKDQTAQLLARKQLVETLQVNRSASVKLLRSTLCASCLDGVYLKAIRQTGQRST